MKKNNMENTDSPSSSPKKKLRKKTKTTDAKSSSEVDLSLSPIIDSNVDEESRKKAIEELIKNSVNKYADIVDNQVKPTRNDFDVLQPIVSEFLEDFMVIGHTLEGQRVVMRYASSPAKLDALTELSKVILTRMFIQERGGN